MRRINRNRELERGSAVHTYTQTPDDDFCAECDRLRAYGQQLKQFHAAAAESLNAETSESDYNARRMAKEEAFIDLEIARLELERHQRGHMIDTEPTWIM